MILVRRLFSRGALKVLAWLLATIAFTALINVLGIRLVGDTVTWERWLATHRVLLFIWRLCLYAAIAWGWWWMHQRVMAREPDRTARWRLLRGELAAVLLIVVFEVAEALR